jgi:transposase
MLSPYPLGAEMGKHRTPYPVEFRAQMVELARAGRRPEELENEFEPTAQTIYNSVAQADRDKGLRHDGLTTAERQELTRLRREVWQPKIERDILSICTRPFATVFLCSDRQDGLQFYIRTWTPAYEQDRFAF